MCKLFVTAATFPKMQVWFRCNHRIICVSQSVRVAYASKSTACTAEMSGENGLSLRQSSSSSWK
jgi:hypothetical protein